jgi:hypothetical protein
MCGRPQQNMEGKKGEENDRSDDIHFVYTQHSTRMLNHGLKSSNEEMRGILNWY